MAMNLGSSRASRCIYLFSNPFRSPSFSLNSHSALFLLFLSRCSISGIATLNRVPFFSSSKQKHRDLQDRVSARATEGEKDESCNSDLLDDDLLRKVSVAKDADEALEMIIAQCGKNGGVVGASDCRLIIAAALDRNNVHLVFSIFSAMRSSFDEVMKVDNLGVKKWRWARPDAHTYAFLVRGFAESLKVSDAIKIIGYVSRMGVSQGEEVPFGKIVRCPTCMIAIAVAQPQHGTQVASCSKCRYQYALVSGDIISIESEQLSVDVSAWERGLRFLQIIKQSIPAAVHSIVIQTPAGTACTYKFATKTVNLPAKEGERVTISLAAPLNVYQEVGPFKMSAKTPGRSPGEAMSLTNHSSGQVSHLLRAPVNDGNSILQNPPILFPVLAALASGEVASGIIDPNLPRFILVAAVASIALGATINNVVFPQLSQLPQRMIDVVALRQQLLSQYDMLQNRIKDLCHSGEKEVWMLARMCQLENKILAVGEPSYRSRRSRVKRVRESLGNSLSSRIELIDSYAKISSMIEIEVEMDSDVLAAEAVSNAESIAEQIQQIMELENLEQRWRMQAEVNDEVETLLSSQPVSTEPI